MVHDDWSVRIDEKSEGKRSQESRDSVKNVNSIPKVQRIRVEPNERPVLSSLVYPTEFPSATLELTSRERTGSSEHLIELSCLVQRLKLTVPSNLLLGDKDVRHSILSSHLLDGLEDS